MPKAAHIFAPLVQLLKGPQNRKKSKKSQVCEQNQFDQLIWNEKAFNDLKCAIVYATLLRHPIPRTELSIWVDASDVDYSQSSWRVFCMSLAKGENASARKVV